MGEVLKGARRTLGVAQKCKDPLLLNDIIRFIVACPKNLLGVRDRALILIGFAGVFRRSELCAMTVSDLCFSDSGLVISVPRSKAAQEQAGEKSRSFLAGTRILADQSAAQMAVEFQCQRRRCLSRSRSSRPRIIHRLAPRLNRSDLQNRRDEGRHECNQHRWPQCPRWNGDTSGIERIVRTRHREDHRHRSRRVLRRYIRPGEMFRENA